MRRENRCDHPCCQRVFLGISKQSIAFGQRRLKLNDANEWWGGFAARPIFAAEFRRRTSLFPFSTNKRQTPTPPFERCTRRPAYD